MRGGKVSAHFRHHRRKPGPLRIVLAALAVAGLTATAANAQIQRRATGGLSEPAEAENDAGLATGLDSETIGAFFPQRADLDAMRARGLVRTGLEPAYPERARCPVIDSPFGVDTRGDGSLRQKTFFRGYHGGADIPVPEGTPVLAVADGTVVHKKMGAGIGGIELVLQHAPEDTGFSVWTYTEYKHLMRLPELEIGRRVRRGEAVALSGKTGTAGRHYGPGGHAHLHLTAFFSGESNYRAGAAFVPMGGQWLDPLALFRAPLANSQALVALPAAQKTVTIAYMTADGEVVPADARVVWPLACTRR
ncbi:MAG: M23 family metallopeptidase [Alphaproteobacteria bacterium]|nr:M23 family metallopeptidase [Alphaproteobacteria bacterium]